MNAWRLADPRVKAAGLLLLVAALAALAWLLPRVPQPQRYHHFADPYVCFGLPRCLDISSNALILLAGAAGLRFLRSAAARRAFIEPAERRPYTLLFLATLLVGLGSGYYHLAPDNERLAWDRAALALALMSWLAANLCERIDPATGLRLLPLLLAAGLGSVVYWNWSEANGMGDLRPYGLMQLLPLLLVPLLLWLYPPRYSGDKDVLAITGLYLLALLGDLLDHQIAALTGLVSGHTMKHVIAALAIYGVLLRLKRRRIMGHRK